MTGSAAATGQLPTPSGELAPEVGFWCCEFELSGTGEARSVVPGGQSQHRARALVRLHGAPMGYVVVPRDAAGPDTGALVRAAFAELSAPIRAHLAAEGLPLPGLGEAASTTSTASPTRPDAPAPGCPTSPVVDGAPVTAVVCTRNRAHMLDTCFRALSAIDYPSLEIVIVDNAPTDGSTRARVEAAIEADSRFRYVHEPRPGLSRARNRALAEAGGTYIAYTDDDVSVDRNWVSELVRGFQRRDDVGCATGLVCTAGITTTAEAYFDARTEPWSNRFLPEVFDLSAAQQKERGYLYPYSPGIFGTGANFAFDRQLVRDLGNFDEALGTGTRTRGGEDLDMFLRVLNAGRSLAYEPSSIVWHHHRADEAALLKQMYGYGTGMSAVIVKLLLNPKTRTEVLRRLPAGFARIAKIRKTTQSRLEKTTSGPKGAMLREFAGFGAGPALYGQAVRATRRANVHDTRGTNPN